MQIPRYNNLYFIIIFNLLHLMLSFGLSSTMKRFDIALRSKSSLISHSSSISRKYLTKNRKYFDVILQQSVTNRKSLILHYSTITIGFVASSLLLYSISQSIEVSSCDELPINNDSTSIDPLHDTAMYPPILSFEKGMLVVSDIHSIAYSVYGNPDGKPVLGTTVL